MEHRISEPFTTEKFKDLKAGDTVLLTGTIYTARDAAHKRMLEMLERGESLPFDIKNAVMWGPRRKNRAIRSVPQARLPAIAWMLMRPRCWIWAKQP